MSETNATQPFAASGSGKSPEEIAFELVSKLKGQGVWGERNRSEILDMYAECLDAVKGLRTYEGQSRVFAPINGIENMPAPAVTPAQQPTIQAAPPIQAATEPASGPAPVQATPVTPQVPTQLAPTQPPASPQPAVRVQQQSLQEAVDAVYNQG